MADDLLTVLLPAIEIAAFERRADGSFTSIAPPPPWFSRLVADETFPFLGHILEEAVDFWRQSRSGMQEWGPCAESDGAGREFHYKVVAVSANGRQFLLFELDTASDRMREVLQAARERALAAGSRGDEQAGAAAAQRDVRRMGAEMRELLRRLAASGPTAEQLTVIEALTKKCDALLAGFDDAVQWSPLSEIALRLRPPKV
jgi:hypothetical protein